MTGLNEVRNSLVGNIAAMEQYRIRQGQVLSAQDAWQKKITDGKATFGDLIRNHRMLSGVLKDQIALQRSVGVGWSQSTKTGKFSVDQFIPQTLSRDLRTARAEIGLMSNIMSVASDNMVKWGKNTQWAGRQLMVGFTVPLGIAAAATGKLAYDMDKAITQVVKVYGDAAGGVQEATESIRMAATETASAAARIYGQSAQETLGIMAALAASGKSGLELQQATMSTTRAAILGELEWQDAVKATISMQEVYQASQEQLADNWNYINAMENQTVLSAQDFVTAIPKVSGVMEALGADLKDTGLLLTAFKAAGIDAAEGANALKSINFRLVATYGKGLETFKAATGKDLRKIIDETNGETIPSLERFADAIKGLSAPDKTAVIRDVFGIYQGSKALMLLEQMTNQTDQWNQAMKVGANTALQNAAIAQQELARQSERPFKAIDRAIATLQINLSKFGEVFLPPAAALLDVVGRIVNGINSMNPALKTLIGIAGILVALAGPAIMLVGLMANLAGSVMKGVSSLGMLATGFKMMTVEERMQQIVGSKSIGIWDSQTAALAGLTLQMQHFNAAMAVASKSQDAMAAARPFGPITHDQHKEDVAIRTEADQTRADQIFAKKTLPQLNLPYTQGANGNWAGRSGEFAFPETARRGNEEAIAAHEKRIVAIKEESLAQAQGERAARAKTEADRVATEQSLIASKATQEQADKARRLGQSMAGAAVGVGVLGSMLGGNEGVNTALMTFGTVGMLMPGVMTKLGSAAMAAGGKIKGAFGAAGGSLTSLMSMAKGAGPVLAAVAIVGFVAWKHFQDQIDESRNKMIALNDTAKNMADLLGYSYTTTGNVDTKSQVNDGMRATQILAEKFKETNADAARAFSENEGKSLGEKWGAAIAAGVDAKMHGATTEQAENTARVAMALMGQHFSDADFKAQIGFEIDFDEMDSMVSAKLKHWREQFSEMMSDGGTNALEQFFNSGQLSQRGGEAARKAGSEFWSIYFNADEKDRKDIITQVAAQNDKYINDAFEAAKKRGVNMQNLGINNATDFAKALSQNVLSATSLGLTPEQFEALQRQNGWMVETARAAAIAGNVDANQIGNVYRLFDLLRYANVTSLLPQAPDTGLFAGIKGGLEDLNNVTGGTAKKVNTTAKALEYFGTVAAGAEMDTEKFNQAMKDVGTNSAITYDVLENSLRSTYTNAQSAIFEEASRQFSDMQSRAYDRESKNADAMLDAISAKGDRIAEQFDRREQQMNDRQEAQKKRFDKNWDARMKREEGAYDKRIANVQRAIDAEQKAEDIRQKIFEAEKTRIQRLAEMYSRSIDINMAISSGQLDEAAKISANGAATELQWGIDDASANTGDASKKRIDALNSQKDTIEEAKKVRMDALDAIREREQENLDQRLENEKRALRAEEDSAKKSIEIEKKRQQGINESHLAGVKRTQAITRAKFESDLAELRAFLPKNQAQFTAQATRLEQIYNGYGGRLKAQGKTWAGYVAGQLNSQIKIETRALKSVVNWSKIGADIATQMMRGAFNMSPAQFAAFIKGGTPPKTSLFGSTPKSGVTPTTTTKTYNYAGRVNDPNNSALHKGGVAGGSDYSRAGWSGEKKPSEVDTRLLVGEGVINRKGMRMIGKAGLDNINKGGGMGGGGTMGIGSLPAVMGAVTGKQLIQQTIQGVHDKAAGRMGAYLGASSGIQGPSVGDLVSNIAGAATAQRAYTSGRVVYLGHGSYPGGANLGPTVRPTSGRVVSEFGPRNLLGMTFHNGIDIANVSGTPIKAAAAGRVIYTGWDNTGYGNYVQMQSSDGTMFGYGHNSSINVRAGQRVAAGTQIARMGNTGKSTGPHSHFQTGRSGRWFNPRVLFPQLANGGFTMNEGLANLHPKETVITKPLTEKFKQGVDNFANPNDNGYTVLMDFTGANFNNVDDIETAFVQMQRKMEKKSGVIRKIGTK